MIDILGLEDHYGDMDFKVSAPTQATTSHFTKIMPKIPSAAYVCSPWLPLFRLIVRWRARWTASRPFSSTSSCRYTQLTNPFHPVLRRLLDRTVLLIELL